MADKKISEFPIATVPLVGSEVVVGVQGGATKQLAVSEIAKLAPTQDHNVLLNLNVGDVHSQYLNNTRGDLRYVPLLRNVGPGNGLIGGGALSADISLTAKAAPNEGIAVTVNGIELDINSLGALPEAIDPTNDLLVIYNASEARERKVGIATALAGASGFVPIARLLNSGNGLTGGGDLSVDRTFAVGAGTGILVNADDVALDITHTRNIDHSAVSVIAGVGLSGGGTIQSTRTLQLDTTNLRNVDHGTIAVSAGTGLSGGGDLTAPRTISLDIAGNDQIGSLGCGTPAPGGGGIRATGDISAFFSSDIRLKENVQQIPRALPRLLRMRGVTFDWNNTYISGAGGEDGYFLRKRDIGVIAQEVEKEFPEIVGTREDGTLAVKYDRLVAVLIEAVRELTERVRDLEAK